MKLKKKNSSQWELVDEVPAFGNGGVNTLEGDLYSKVLMERNRDKKFVQRAFNPQDYPVQQNTDGSTSTHSMGWGTDDEGQAWMFPTIFNDDREAIKVPNQYADYISSTGYKKATNIPVQKHGGKLPKMPQGGGVEQFLQYPSSTDDNRQKVLTENKVKAQFKGTQQNPINLPEVEISTPRSTNVDYGTQVARWSKKHPEFDNYSSGLANAMFVTPITEALHTPSRLVNQIISKGQAPYNSEISETLGWQNNDQSDYWKRLRNFTADNVADFITPMAPKGLNTETGLLKDTYKLNPFAKTEISFTNGKLTNSLPTSNPTFIQRGVGTQEAIDDLLNTGIVRNRQSAGLPSKNRWGEKVYWGEEGSPLASNKFNIIAKNSKGLANRPVSAKDIKDILVKNEQGHYTSLPNWQERINKPHWLKGYKELPRQKLGGTVKMGEGGETEDFDFSKVGRNHEKINPTVRNYPTYENLKDPTIVQQGLQLYLDNKAKPNRDWIDVTLERFNFPYTPQEVVTGSTFRKTSGYDPYTYMADMYGGYSEMRKTMPKKDQEELEKRVLNRAYGNGRFKNGGKIQSDWELL